jgi:predicted dehydrogenase
MIHDIDVVLSLVDDELASVEALGAAVLGPNEDWAQARLTFAGGCVANLFASRVAWQTQRTMQVVGHKYVAAIDFGSRQAKLMKASQSVVNGEIDVSQLSPQQRMHLKEHLFRDYLPLVDLPVAEANPLLEEQREFVGAIRGAGAVRVSGHDGRRALDVAERVLVEIAAHRWDGDSAGAAGPRFERRDAVLRGPHWHQITQRRKAG